MPATLWAGEVGSLTQQVGATGRTTVSSSEIVLRAKEVSQLQLFKCSLDTRVHNCGAFLDAVWRKLRLSVPWKSMLAPDIHFQRQCFENCKDDWTQVWPIEGDSFADFREQAGDLCIWDKSTVETNGSEKGLQLKISRFEHAGILDGKGEIISPIWQSGIPFAEADWRLICRSAAIGTPTVIFRYRHLRQRQMH